MSRRPSRFIPHVPPVPMSVPRAYYLQDDADFSEGEIEPPFTWTENGGPSTSPQGMHENMGNQADVTELYRRKPEEHYLISQEVVMPEELPRYYYRPATMARLPQRRLPVAITPSTHATGGPSQVPHPGGYFPPPLEESRVQYDGIVYRSSPHLHRMPPDRTMSPNARVIRRPHQAMPENNAAVNNMVRTVRTVSKPPVSVPTPRFYRRSSNIYKRPSTLCLQLPSTPDPGTRAPKTRFPSTIPGLSLPPMGLRPVQAPHFQTSRSVAVNRGPQMLERQREPENSTPRKNLTARSAPPRCLEERLNNDEEMERMERIIYDQKRVNEFGDDSGSNQEDAEQKCSELELLLNHYEATYRNNLEQSSGIPKQQNSRRSSTKSRAKRKVSVSRLTGLMKPRLPPSLKGLQKRVPSKQVLTSSADEDRSEIEQMTAEVLDNLLQDLSVGGLAGDTQPPRHSSELKKTDSKHVSRAGSKPGSRDTSRGVSRVQSRTCSKPSSRAMSARVKKEKSTKDITEKKSNHNLTPKKSETFRFVDLKNPASFEDIPTDTTFMQDKDKFSKYINSSHTSFEPEKHFAERRSRDPTPFRGEETKEGLRKVPESSGSKDNVKKGQWTKKAKSEDHTALELHRSKSYIVNLIDRALSRELGTIPEEKSSKQYLNLDARTAMDLISAKNLDAEMCVEITQAIADSFNSVGKDKGSPTLNHLPAGSSKHPDSARSDSKESELVFSTGNEEPLYIKQLKKLRWGHLKHIQREMRRLEDLERFLDSCGSDK